jgi:hypothetical protein
MLALRRGSRKAKQTMWRLKLDLPRRAISGLLRAGTTIRTRVKFLGRKSYIDRRVIACEPKTRFVTESLKPFPLTIAWTFQPENGGTRVVRDGHLMASGIVGLLSPILRRIAWRTDQASLERMKTLLEARSSVTPS